VDIIYSCTGRGPFCGVCGEDQCSMAPGTAAEAVHPEFLHIQASRLMWEETCGQWPVQHVLLWPH